MIHADVVVYASSTQPTEGRRSRRSGRRRDRSLLVFAHVSGILVIMIIIIKIVAPLQFVLKRASIATKSLRFYSTASSSGELPQQELVARQMIQYALGHARSQKSGESYAQAMMIWGQGLSNSGEDARGMFTLAMSAWLYERGEIQDAVEKLQMVRQSEGASPELNGNASLSNGEFLHANGNLSAAKELYHRVLNAFEEKDIAENSSLSSANKEAW